MVRQFAQVLIVLGPSVGTVLVGCQPQPVGEKELVAVKVAAVDRVASGTGTRYSAEIEPATRVDLAFKVGGYVEAIAKATGVDGKPRLLQEGDAVRENQELASLRKTDYAQKLDEARADYAQARATADQAQRDVARAQSLVQSGSVSNIELENARTKLDSASAAAAGAKAREEQAATGLGDASLRSPLTGVVLKRSIEVGTLASPGSVAFTIADVASVKAIFAVPDVVLPRVQLGAAQSVTTEAFPGAMLTGRISRISPSADPKSRVFEAEVTIPNADGRLKTGMIAALSIAAAPGGGGDAPLVPLSAIVRAPAVRGREPAFAVYVADAPTGRTRVHARQVELGDYLGRVIPVKKGLTGGEQVVVLGAGLLSDGEAVEVLP